MDNAKLREAVERLLEALGEDPTREGLADTPERVASLFAELYRGVGVDPVTVLANAKALAESDN